MEGTPETLKSSNRLPQPLSDESRCRGAIYGLFIGDALAMPVHWYYDTLALQRDYGHVTDFVAPKNPHPDSILWRSSYSPLNEKANILHDQAQYWGKRGIHYHQFLEAGEYTLNLKLCALLMESLNAYSGYSSDDYLKRYIAFMTTPGNHRDTYVEEYHRHFFTNYAGASRPISVALRRSTSGAWSVWSPLLFSTGIPPPGPGKRRSSTSLSLTWAKRWQLLLRSLSTSSLKCFQASPFARSFCSRSETRKIRCMDILIGNGSLNPTKRWWECTSAQPVTWRTRCRRSFISH